MLSKSSIKIYARIKPSLQAINYYDIALKDTNSESLIIHTSSKEKKDGSSTSHSFSFQKVFTEAVEQAELYNIVAYPVVEAVFSGYNGAILAYGQTGTGKTHSISGGVTPYSRGMIPRAFQQIFDMVAADQANNSPREFTVSVSTLEIYNELCIDLLSKFTSGCEEKCRVELREDAAGNVRLRNLKEYPVRNMQDVEKYITQSITNRITADTPMNQHSSRSHCIFTLYLRQRVNGEKKQVKSKLHLIDLSGSERVWKNRSSTNLMSERSWKNRASGSLLYEAKHINLSLHYLEQVIIALNDPKRSHVPYRNSSITNFLRDSLGGNSRTAMVFTISLEPNNFFETLSTCRFSQRVSLVKNHTRKIIEYDKDEELDFLRLEVERLKRIISEMIGNSRMKLRLHRTDESQQPEGTDKAEEPTELGAISSNGNIKPDDGVDVEMSTPPTSEETTIPCREAKDAESQTSFPLLCSSSDDESGDVNSNLSIASSTYLDEIYSLLSEEDTKKSDLLNINKLLPIIGLKLPYSARNSGIRFSSEDEEKFKKYLELPQNREALRVYVKLNIMFDRHVRSEQYFMEKVARVRTSLTKSTSSLQSITDNDSKSQSGGDENCCKPKVEVKYRKTMDQLMRLKKKRLHYLKLFNQTKLMLAEGYQDWRSKQSESRISSSNLAEEEERLARWVYNLRFPNNCENQSNT